MGQETGQVPYPGAPQRFAQVQIEPLQDLALDARVERHDRRPHRGAERMGELLKMTGKRCARHDPRA